MAESKEIVRQLAGFVADYMTVQSPFVWKVNPDRNPASVGAYIYEEESGAEIFIRPDQHGKPDRVVIQSSYPDGWTRQVSPDPIQFQTSVDRFRDPHQIAAQVLRKVTVPEFFAEYRRCVERIGQDAAMVEVRGAVADRLVEAFKADWVQARVSEDTPEGHECTVSWWRSDAPGRARIHADAWINYRADRIRLKLDELTADQAVKVMELLGTFY